MLSFLKKTKEAVFDILFSSLCLGCSRFLPEAEKAAFLCESCFGSLLLHDALSCPVCGNRLPNNTSVCHKDSPLLLGAATNYEAPLIKLLIWDLKYKRHTAAAKAMSRILTSYVEKLSLDLTDFVIIPLPLHRSRERSRGFNQAELMAWELTKSLRLPLVANIIKRIKPTLPQVEVGGHKERKENMAGAFQVIDPAQVNNKSFLVIDDVSTSGATLREIAQTLKIFGAKKVIGLVVAKA